MTPPTDPARKALDEDRAIAIGIATEFALAIQSDDFHLGTDLIYRGRLKAFLAASPPPEPER